MKYINYIKKHKSVFIVVLIMILIYPTITFGRFIYSLFQDHYYTTKNFYFNSDLLNKEGTAYTISNWSGVDQYVLTINMNSILNEKKYATSDIDYDIFYECDEKVNCYLSKDKGTIIASDKFDNNRDSFSLTIVPKKQFVNNEETKIKITTKSTKPYVKTLSADFTLKASKVGLSYEITDNKNDIFAILRLTNSLTYYTVSEAFDNYHVGDEIDQYNYSKLSNENKLKCSSLSVRISFDPRIVNLDVTNAYYLKTLKNNPSNIKTVKLRRIIKEFDTYKLDDLIDEETYQNLNNGQKKNISDSFDYVNDIIINVDAISSADLKFYKKNKKNNYTYPFVNEVSIITVS